MIDVLALSQEIDSDSRSGKLSEQLLAEENTLYGKNAKYPHYLERITSDGRATLGYFKNGEFEAIICLLGTDV